MQQAYELPGNVAGTFGCATAAQGARWRGATLGNETPFRSAAALFRLAALMHGAAEWARTAANQLDAWLDRRRIAHAALDDLGTMSDRELLDIGLTRVDLQRVAWGASDRVYLQPEI